MNLYLAIVCNITMPSNSSSSSSALAEIASAEVPRLSSRLGKSILFEFEPIPLRSMEENPKFYEVHCSESHAWRRTGSSRNRNFILRSFCRDFEGHGSILNQSIHLQTPLHKFHKRVFVKNRICGIFFLQRGGRSLNYYFSIIFKF